MSRFSTRVVATATVLLASIPALQGFAQWTGDAANPSVLVSGNSEQVQPKLRPAPGGGFYMAWLDNRTGGYDTYVQRFNANGVAQWPSPGVLIVDTSFSSTEDYGFTVDGSGNAVVIFRDDRFGGVRIGAQAVSPAGATLWGANGVAVTANGDVHSPKATAGTDGGVYAGWLEGNKGRILRLNAAGGPDWGAPYIVTDGSSANYPIADLQPGDNGSVIASIVRSTNYITGAKIMHAQKLSPAGVPLWPTPTVQLFTMGSLQIANYPSFVPDGSGGGVFAFYKTSPLQCFVQWVGGDGVRKFGSDSTAVTTADNFERTDPGVTIDIPNSTVYVDWVQHTPASSNFGVYAQSFNSAGVRLWGTTGVALQPIVTTYQFTQTRTIMLGGNPTFLWVGSSAFGVDTIYAMEYTVNFGFMPPPINVALPPGAKGRLAALTLASGSSAAIVWEGSATGGVDLMGQGLNDDGTIGPSFNAADFNHDGVVDGADLGSLLGAWGPCAGCPQDLNGDGVVDGADLGTLLGAWTD